MVDPLAYTAPRSLAVGQRIQMQRPLLLHVVPTGQATQAFPPLPQLPSDCEANGTQLLPLQQPRGQEVASQTQLPAKQRWPSRHAEPKPQLHAPLEQPSAWAPQLTQAAPPEPQDVMVCAPNGTQVLPLQQPDGHDEALQTQLPETQL
jgi:hypothetical protein